MNIRRFSIRNLFRFDTAQYESRGYHITHLIIHLALITIPFFLSLGNENKLTTRLGSFDVPKLCIYKQVCGADCPGCGLSRSFVHVAHGHFEKSLVSHQAGIALFLYCLFQVNCRLVFLLRPATKPSKFVLYSLNAFPMIMLTYILVLWIIKI